MTPEQMLLQGFDYDLWANGKWLRALGRFRDMGRPQEILEHILTAQRHWLAVCGVQFSQNDVNVAWADIFRDVADAWKEFVEATDLDSVIDVSKPGGSEESLTLMELTWHVLNHGTYHRGHLRGLAEREGWDPPGTDFLDFVLEG